VGNKDSDDGVGKAIGGVIVGIVVLIAVVPKPVWIFLGIMTAVAVVVGGAAWAFTAYEKHRAAAEAQAKVQRAAQAAAAKREREARARQERQHRIETLGEENAAFVESALAAVKQVGASEAARAGWLGDVDFTADIREITDNFQKARAVRDVACELSALDKPSLDDRKLLAEAKTTAAKLERAAFERVELIGKCATEARLIDKSLQSERDEARTAEQRADLHGKLSALIYGIEATPDTTPTSSAADAVMARVQAYREIKNQIQLARDT
jgi:electron transfer flavoprotein alpha subunit